MNKLESTVAGKPLRLNREDIEIGTAEEVESGKFEFSPGGTILTSVRVNGHRDDNSLDGPVGLLFGPLFGVTDFSPSLISAATSTERDIALVLDVSGSMGTDNRFESLADALNLIREAFADEVASGNTAIGLGLRSGLDSLLNDPESRPFAFKSIVVMTDGKHNTAVDPEVAAQECRDESVTVITVTFSEGADRTRMQTVANIANGEHFHANSGSELDDAFTQIARQLAVLIIE